MAELVVRAPGQPRFVDACGSTSPRVTARASVLFAPACSPHRPTWPPVLTGTRAFGSSPGGGWGAARCHAAAVHGGFISIVSAPPTTGYVVCFVALYPIACARRLVLRSGRCWRPGSGCGGRPARCARSRVRSHDGRALRHSLVTPPPPPAVAVAATAVAAVAHLSPRRARPTPPRERALVE